MSKLSEKQKWIASAIGAVLFVIVSLPQIYQLVELIVSKLSGKSGLISNNGCPTMVGIILHGIVFLLLVRASMQIPMKKEEEQQNPSQ
jgi:hypothetical protein